MATPYERDDRGRPLRYTGEQEDGDVSGLYYLRARYYDPALGRFWTQDPWGGSAASPQTLNPYPYVGSNPANLVDPAGLCHRGTGHGPTIVDTVKTIFSLGMQQPPKRNCTGDGLAGEPIVAEGEEIADTLEPWVLRAEKRYAEVRETCVGGSFEMGIGAGRMVFTLRSIFQSQGGISPPQEKALRESREQMSRGYNKCFR